MTSPLLAAPGPRGAGHESVVILTPYRAETPGIEGPFREMFEQSLGGTVIERIEHSRDGWQQQLEALLGSETIDSADVKGTADMVAEVVRTPRDLGFRSTVCATC